MPFPPAPDYSPGMTDFHTRVEELRKQRGMTPTAVSRAAGRSDSWFRKMMKTGTIPQGRNLTDLGTALRTTTAYMLDGDGPADVGLDEDETAPFDFDDAPTIASLVRAAIAGRNAVVPWAVETGSLVGAGIFRGDVLICDLNGKARDGSLVVAQIYDREMPDARTVIRFLHANILFSVPPDPKNTEYISANDSSVAIKAVVESVIRPMR